MTADVPARSAPWVLALLVVLVQVPYPLLHGDARLGATTLAVLVFFAASATHAFTMGRRSLVALVAVGCGGGYLAELVGVTTGFPFGRYSYSLQPQVGGVPLLVPLAWAMMLWPTLVVVRRLLPGRVVSRAAVGGIALAGWDLFLDPQMIRAGYWHWAGGQGPVLNGVPLVNTLGWLVVGTVLVCVLDVLTPSIPDGDQPLSLWTWTWLGSTVADAAFLGQPATALAGAVGMGLVGVPVLLAVRRQVLGTRPQVLATRRRA